MFHKLKTWMRLTLRAAQHAGHYPLRLPQHKAVGQTLQSINGQSRPVSAGLLRALDLCDGTRTLATVAREARLSRKELIAAHEQFLVTLWRSPVPARPPTLEHTPHLIIVSPHLDDAPLSCGGRMLGDRSALVLNIFDQGAGWRFPSTEADLPAIQSIRHAEEDLISRMTGVPIQYLGLPEALRRGRELSEIFTAAIDGRDDEAGRTIEAAVGGLAQSHPTAHWYLPLGVGNHLDHRIARNAALAALVRANHKASHIHFYEDQPYQAKGKTTTWFDERADLKLQRDPLDLEDTLCWKLELLRVYWTQLTLQDIQDVGRYARSASKEGAVEIAWTITGR